MNWTEQTVAELRRCYPKEGAKKFAARYGMTTNQVIGKARRLGLVFDPVVRPPRAATEPKVKPAKTAIDEAGTDPRYRCCWPDNYGVSCGNPVMMQQGRRHPYCPRHCQKAYHT